MTKLFGTVVDGHLLRHPIELARLAKQSADAGAPRICANCGAYGDRPGIVEITHLFAPAGTPNTIEHVYYCEKHW